PNDGTDYADTDGDLVPDYVETTYQPNNGGVATNANDPNDFTDTDNGGVPDYVETILFPNSGLPATNPAVAADDNQDSDGDGVTDYNELVNGSNPGNPCDPNPNAVACPTGDFDGDGVLNGVDPDPVDPCIPNPCGVTMTSKVFLGGPYDDALGMMHDSLRVLNLIPTAQPYNALTDYNYTGTETVNPSVFTTTGPDAIVDWVFVELRDATDPKVSLHKRAALVQRDGDIVDLDGTSPLTFAGVGTGNYYVSVRHRNHLGVLTQAPVTFGVVPPVVDFTLAATSVYQVAGPTGSPHARQEWSNNKRSLWPGNMSNSASTGDRIIYQGADSDTEEAYFRVLLDPNNLTFLPNFIALDYHRADANMDGRVIYQGGNSDTDVVFFTVLLFPGNQITFLPNYVVFEQIPK
ncbi:MAG: hypothetical protein JNJ90_07145, partial [Saprospiraceae bacterium]|nr:hypothetical protein [Saprospiraceae bacterium]